MTWVNHHSRSSEEHHARCFGKQNRKGRTVLSAHAREAPLHQGCAAKGLVRSYARDPAGAPGWVSGPGESTGTLRPLTAASGVMALHCRWEKGNVSYLREERVDFHSDPRDWLLPLSHQARLTIQLLLVTTWSSTLVPFGWRLDLLQGRLLHHI